MTEDDSLDQPGSELPPQETKQCPYCAETILAAAIKCRYCGEFLNRPLKSPTEFPELKDAKQQTTDKQNSLNFSYDTSPSIWGLFGVFLKTILLVAVLIFLSFWPINQLLADFGLSENLIAQILKYRILVGIGITAVIVLVFLYKVLKLKSTHYHINPDRVEWSRGIFERRIDNIDMFRVIDLRLQRTLPDCLLGIGTVVLITNDKTDPEFEFAKIRKPKYLYNIIKQASIQADAKRGVVHLE